MDRAETGGEAHSLVRTRYTTAHRPEEKGVHRKTKNRNLPKEGHSGPQGAQWLSRGALGMGGGAEWPSRGALDTGWGEEWLSRGTAEH